jgi:hypothetical protein
MVLRQAALAVGLGAALMGCSNNYSGPMATPAEAAQAAYKHDGPPAITLYTMVNNSTGSGAHSSIMINAPSQRVIFDPAGTVKLSLVPEIDDVLYGVTPQIERMYASAHARAAYHVRIQQVQVPGEVAEQALQAVQANGKVGAALCTVTTSRILKSLPGFGDIGTTYFPNSLADDFAQLPGVSETRHYENDGDDKDAAVLELEAKHRTGQ